MLRRCFLRSLAAAPAAGLVNVPLLLTREAFAQRGGMPPAEPFKPTDEANSPMGVAKGIHPGRVVWVQDAKATSWDGTTGHWWDDANTDQKVVHGMTSKMVQNLTGRKNDKQAWDALFHSFNETHKFGNAGYRPGEKIAIKLNCNQDRAPEWGAPQVMPAGGARGGGPPGGGPPNAARGGGDRGGGPPAGARGGGMPRGPLNGLPSPHAVVALITDLIEAGGVRGEDIIIYDVTGGRNVGKPISDRIKASTNKQFQAVNFLVGTDFEEGGRISATPDMANPIQFAKADLPAAYLSQQVNAAKYMINMALLRPHGMAGVTLIGKNHFGSVYFPEGGGWSPRTLHNAIMRTQAVGSYNPLVELMGHKHLGGKTMLYLLDGLYTAEQNEGNVFKWASFNDHWASSLVASQDPVAVDSVGIDILRSEPRATQLRGNADNYLHEAAQANKPPSGTVYNPDKSGVLASLGVHEHWNNATDKKYSRNLGRKQGIELIVAS